MLMNGLFFIMIKFAKYRKILSRLRQQLSQWLYKNLNTVHIAQLSLKHTPFEYKKPKTMFGFFIHLSVTTEN